jgi:hypothetical protein
MPKKQTQNIGQREALNQALKPKKSRNSAKNLICSLINRLLIIGYQNCFT